MLVETSWPTYSFLWMGQASPPFAVLMLLLQRQCVNYPKRIKPDIKGLLAQCYHRYTKLKQNKKSLVIIWQRDCHIFTKDLSNFQQHQPITILRRRFRSNGVEGDKRWREEKGPNERKKIQTFVLQRIAGNLQELFNGFHGCLKLVATQDNKIIFTFSCFVVFFIHPITNAGAYLLDCHSPSFTIFHIMWNYSFQSVQIFLVFHLQPYYLKFTVDFTPYSISNLSFWNVFIPPDFHNAQFIT